jgi:ADP-ribose pyrophosphatase YjhB (NUDIX family)
MKVQSAGGVVFDRTGRIALVRQRDRRARLRWTLPKGRLERGESPAQAALREVYEETGLVTKLVDVLGVYDGKRRRTHYFRMLVWRDHGVFDDETEEVRFVRPARALRLLRSRRDRTVLAWATARRGAGGAAHLVRV